MSSNQTYGYHRLDKENYNNIIVPANLKKEIPYDVGYNWNATNFVCSKIAKETPACGFINTTELLKCQTENDAAAYLIAQSQQPNLIAGEIPINPENNQFILLNDFIKVLHFALSNENMLQVERFVANLSISALQKETHGVALCIDADKANKNLNIIILEQHAKRDSGPLDYSHEIDATLKYLQNCFHDIGFQINTFQNQEPICRQEHVCGIVSSELCRRLLQAADPMKLAQQMDNTRKTNPFKNDMIDAHQIQKLHQENFQAYQTKLAFERAKTDNKISSR